jgi:RNA polymerase sigma factor (sigma-70 family)
MAKAVSSPILHLIRQVVEDQSVRQLCDRDLLQRFGDQRDEAAFDTLLRRYGPMVLDVCRGVLGNEADAEDAFQSTFLILARKAASIRKSASVGSWLHGVAYRTALKARAQLATRQKTESRAPARPISEPDDLTWREVRQVLHEELTGLAERYRVPLVVCYLEGKTQDAAAALLGLAKSTLKERLERGRSLLRARMVRRGLGPAAALIATAWPSTIASACVQATLVSRTVTAASLFAAGQAAPAGVISVKVAALTEGVLKTMLLSKIKSAAALALLLSACVGGALAFLPGVAGPNETAKHAAATGDQGEAQKTVTPLRAQFPDLTKIDRTIVKEPTYRNQPYYALLAFGPEAKKRVWLVVDGETLYVDRNGNGDLTEANERVAKTKKIEVAPGMYKWMDSFDLGEVQGLRLRLDFWVRDKDFVPENDFDKKVFHDHQENGWEFATLFRVKPDGSNIEAQIPVTFCRQPKDAQVCHLAGPLTLFLRWGQERRPLVCSANNQLDVMIGTPGLPPRARGEPVFAALATSEVPADAHPVAHFEFPHQDPKQPPIKLEVVLNQRC